MDKFTTFITAKHDSMAAEVYRTEDILIIRPGRKTVFEEALANPLKTFNGTVGEANRKAMHDLLDEWIDHILNKETTRGD